MTGKLPKIIRMITGTIYFVLVFLYLWFYINPALIYYKQQPIFLFDKYFLHNFLVFPGGMAEYLSLFFSQFFFSKLAGCLLITFIIWAAVILTKRLLQYFFSKQVTFWLQFLPGLILIHLHSHYQYDLRGDLIYIASLIFALACLQMVNRPVYLRLVLLLISSLFLFFFFGGTSLLLFSAIIVLSEILQVNRKLFWISGLFQILLCFALIRAIPLVSPYVSFKMAWMGILCPDLYYKPLKFLYPLYLLLPALLFIRILIKYALEATGLTGQIKIHAADWLTPFIIPFFSLLILGLLVMAMRFSFHKADKDAILIHYYADNSKWELVLKTSTALSTTDRTVLFQINRALYHLGRLPDQAFSYPQYWGENGLILTTHYTRDVLMYCSDLYFDMGHIKESLHWAYEAETKSDQAPDVLKRIVLNNIILGEYKVAGKFLKILSRSVIHHKWAMHYLPYLQNESLVQQDELIQEKRKLMPVKDFYISTHEPRSDLVNLLSQNPGNRMAFEYFMLYSLFTHDLATVAANVKHLEKLNYENIPTHIEEAIMLVKTLNPDFPLYLGRYQLSDRTKERFRGYSKIMLAHKNDRVAAQAELFQDYGNTYWYYIYYVSPITTKRKFYEKTK
jgi:hypothetical protein